MANSGLIQGCGAVVMLLQGARQVGEMLGYSFGGHVVVAAGGRKMGRSNLNNDYVCVFCLRRRLLAANLILIFEALLATYIGHLGLGKLR